MKEYTAESIRNVALISHSGAGKTSLVEALLLQTGATNRMGKIEEGNTASDFEDEEIRRQQSLSTSVLPIEFEGHKLNLLDTPGFTDFVGEAISALYVADGAVVLADAVAGVEVGTELLWGYAEQYALPRLVVISKMDRENASFRRAMESIRSLSTDASFIPMQLPMGEQHDFKGVIDLLRMKARPGPGTAEEAIPESLLPAAEEARITLVEAAAEGDDALLEKYLEGGELTPQEVLGGLRAAIRSGRFVPVFLAAATQSIGSGPLMEAMVELLPSPKQGRVRTAAGPGGEESLQADDSGPLAAYVWKTTADPFVGRLTYMRVFSGLLSSDSRVWNSVKEQEERLGPLQTMRGKEQIPTKALHAGDIGVVAKLSTSSTGDTLCDRGHTLKIPMPEYPSALYSVAVIPRTQADSAKISSVLTRLSEEDPTLSWRQEGSTNQTILQGMGDQHIDVGIRRAEGKFQVGLNTEVPRVPYRETITKPGSSQYRHKKQTGGAGQFAEVHMTIEPLEGEEFEFVNKVFGGRISNSFMPAIEKGVRGVLKAGVLAGFPVEKVRVAITDGKEHPVDSKAVAFETAGREAFKLAVNDAGPVLLEPIVDLRITVPEANMGDVLGDLNTRRARVQGMENDRGRSVVTAQVPLAEVQRYTTELRSITGGRGFFHMQFSHYETVPPHVAEGVIAASKREAGKEEAE